MVRGSVSIPVSQFTVWLLVIGLIGVAQAVGVHPILTTTSPPPEVASDTFVDGPVEQGDGITGPHPVQVASQELEEAVRDFPLHQSEDGMAAMPPPPGPETRSP
jgi:hypothetical protein